LQRTAEEEIVSILPWSESRDGGNCLCIPTNTGHHPGEIAGSAKRLIHANRPSPPGL
jgi:hypothetical protein|tara:strand:+ start:1912 stop:2082 length:171 start_codon:yes stop_codon:yes gene_type:complete